MMKFILVMLSFLFLLNVIEIYLISLFMQSLLYLLISLMLILYPLNNMNFWMGVYYNMGIDFYSVGLILLSMWVMVLMVMVSMVDLIFMKDKYYVFIMIFLLLSLVMCFISMNLFYFYLFFEVSLLPIFFLILGWGLQVDRIKAGYYMMLYTFFGSLPLFIMIILIYEGYYSMMMSLIELSGVWGWYFYWFMLGGFLIKMPMYFVHLWLPKAHVEAPLVGSMILAGVMLKLGGYGLMRFMFMFMNLCVKMNKFIIILSVLGGIYSGLICLCQVDMKMLVAYSSVVHMAVLMGGMMTLLNWGYGGGYLMMIAHGLCSSGLFCLVNFNYERLNSRSLMMNKGMINFFPSVSLMWFLLCSSNLSFPPSLNLFSEIMLLSSLIIWSKNLMIMMGVILFLSAAYSLYLYSYSQHGRYNNLLYFMKGILVNEFLLILYHWLPLNFLFILMFIYL